MDIKLKIFLLIICVIFCFYIYQKIRREQLQLRHSLIWFITLFLLMFMTVFDEMLIPLKVFLGFETTSNMIFLIGFFIITLIIFSLTLKISLLQMNVVTLTQEVAIMKKELSKRK